MLVSIFRCIILYFLVVLGFRLMGKRQIGQLQPYELVITLILADLATAPMSDSKIPLLDGIVPLIILLCLHSLITLTTRKSLKLRKIIDGKPIIVITPNGIDYEALSKLNITVDDLLSHLRLNEVFELDEVLFAIIETNGEMSVLKNPRYNEKEKTEIPITIISDGEYMEDNLKLIKMEKKEALNLLNSQNIKNEKNIIVFTINKNGKCYVQEKNKVFKTFKVENKESSL